MGKAKYRILLKEKLVKNDSNQSIFMLECSMQSQDLYQTEYLRQNFKGKVDRHSSSTLTEVQLYHVKELAEITDSR